MKKFASIPTVKKKGMIFYFPKGSYGKKYDSRHIFRYGRFSLAVYRFKWKLYFVIALQPSEEYKLTDFSTYPLPAGFVEDDT